PQEAAFGAGLAAAAWSAASWARVPPHEPQLAWTLSASMIANPPPANGSTRSCAGNASTPTITRRRLLNWTFPGVTVPLGSMNVTCRADRKNDCSYAAYNAVRLPVITQWPPNVRSKEQLP